VNLSEFDDRFIASFILGSPDYEAQLYAIRNLLRRHSRADQKLSHEIEKIDAFARRASGIVSEHAVDEWVDHLEQSVFQSAAHSMGAVGMLAPFIESLFKQAFIGIRERFVDVSHAQKEHARWTMPTKKQWDCRYPSRSPKRANLVEGIMELAGAIGLLIDLPPDLRKTLSALFAYRNKMFHQGFEWPESQRTCFGQRIEAEGWEDWFSQATTDGEPWIFYLNDKFINHCLNTVEQILIGLGAFVRRNERTLDR
jgi:hypothetical protein